jgi:membrane peptidoglycan carboxypeptidase
MQRARLLRYNDPACQRGRRLTGTAHIVRRRHNRRDARQRRGARNALWMALAAAAVILLVVLPAAVVLGTAAVLYGRAVAAMPSPAATIYLDPVIGATELMDREERTVLYRVQDPLGDQRAWIRLDELPRTVIDATLLAEQPDFYADSGFSLVDTLVRMWRYILGLPGAEERGIVGRLAQGALVDAGDAAIDPALRGIVLAAEARRLYGPDALLEWHLNTNYYGSDAYGIDAAARVYLGKRAAELTIDEAALLAAIPLASQFNPLDNPLAARGRRDDLLRGMLGAGLISQAAFEGAIQRPVSTRAALVQAPDMAVDFSLYARRQAREILDSLGLNGARMIARDGLKITTTLDLDLYENALCLGEAYLAALNGAGAAPQAGCTAARSLDVPLGVADESPPDALASVVLDAESGQVLSMTGSALATDRQPGLTLQPVAYLEGFLSAAYTPATMVLDIPRAFAGAADGLIYSPANADGEFFGPLNLRDAMATYRLPPAVAVADSRGIGRVVRSAHRLGYNSLDAQTQDLSLLERGGGVSLLDTAAVYGVFANLGTMRGVDVEPIGVGYRARDPVAVLRIETADGETLWEYDSASQALSETPIFVDSVGYLISDILADARARRALLGERTALLEVGRPAAVVNGLTGDARESWAAGYTPQRVVVWHLGREDGAPLLLDPLGLQGAGPLWSALMRYAHERDGLAIRDWPRPDSIVTYNVCQRSGLLPSDAAPCPTRQETFIREIPPVQQDSFWEVHEVNTQTGQLATANTPAYLRDSLTYFVPPDEALDWWVANGQPLPPTEYDTLTRPDILRAVRLESPTQFAYVGGVVPVLGSIDAEDLRSFELSYGANIDPREWLSITGDVARYMPGEPLASWDTRGLDGVYTLRLTAVMADNSIDSDIALVTVDNQAPVITLLAGEPGQVFLWPRDSVIPLVATVSDNLAIDRVEFFRDGDLIGTDTTWPFGFEYPLVAPGAYRFSARAFDQVGNAATTELTVDVQRSGS